MIDFHTHILPGIDDGADCVEEAIAMLRAEEQQGITQVLATPHFYASHDSHRHFLQERAGAAEILRKAMEADKSLPRLRVGAEVYYFSGISDCDILAELAIEGGRFILIEMPMPPWSKRMYTELEDIFLKQGLYPIVAHVDRYLTPLRTYGIPERLQELPVYVQANANFFLRSTTKRMAMRMLQKEQIHILGSDCHNLEERSPNLGAAIEQITRRLGTEALERIARYEQEILG